MKIAGVSAELSPDTAVHSIELSEIQEALKSANRVYYFALTLFCGSIFSCIACSRMKDPSLFLKLPIFISLPLTCLFLIYAVRQVGFYQFPQANVTFTVIK